ncbi:clustered mitochondria protein homolog [Pholidichthys leucotaenia]
MGNILQCFQTLSNYFTCQDTPAEGGAERSPLLSSDESECESPSLQDDLEDDVLTVSTGLTNPALEPEHFLYPDIILSSNLGEEVTLVEPMVCLLVSEEDEGQEGGAEGRERGHSEVETQTEAETQIGMGVQTETETQAEVQTQTETLECNRETVEEDVINFEDDGKEFEILKELDVFLEAQTTPEEPEKSIGSWSDFEIFHKLEVPANVGRQTKINLKPALQTEQEKCNIEDVFRFQQSAATAQRCKDFAWMEDHLYTQDNPKVKEPNLVTEHNTNKDVEVKSQQMTECSNNVTENGRSFDPFAKQRDHEEKGGAASNIYREPNLSEELISHIHPNTHQKNAAKKEDETIAFQEEDEVEAEIKQMTLFLADRLFLAAPHIKALPEQTDETPEEDPPHQSDEDAEKQRTIRDIVDVQERNFTVTIQSPGAESFEIQVSGQMLVAELQQVLMDHETTCHRTCFSLQLGGMALDSLTELGSNPVIQEGALIKVVEDSYTVRDARLHLRHVRDLLRSLDPSDAYNGENGSSLSYLTFYTQEIKDNPCVRRRRASEKMSVDCSPPEYILPGCKDRPFTPLQPVRDDWKPLQCLRVLTLSSWNPPPGNRKMHGDLLYLNVLTMEDKELNITSSTRGFYLNQSTAFNFNPKPAVPKILCHSLVELLSQVSPAFRKNFAALQKKRVQQHPYERIAAPFQAFTWIAPHADHSLDCVKAEETPTSHMGRDEHTAQSRDWNEELQGCRELPRSSLQERLHRERSIFKTNSDFVAAATRGAVAVIDGNVMPLNPGDSPHMQMFVWSNIFLSQGLDVSEHYTPLGGNIAAHAAAICDLKGAQAYASVDIEGLHTLGTALVDYHGIRVIAQTIVPGLLEKSHEQSIVYGSNDNGKTVFTDPKFLELLGKASKPLRIQPHQVLDSNDCPVELCSGIQTVGIVGNDRRPYVLDLLRTFPPDLNFQFPETEKTTTSEDVPKVCQSFGYPRLHRHSLASLRPELVEAFIQNRYEYFERIVSQELSHLNEQSEESRAGDGATTDAESLRKTAVLKACKMVRSVNDFCFDIRFNPDVCSPGVRFPSECAEEIQRQRRLLWDAAAFLLSDQIPAVLRDCLDHTAMPMDGTTLTSVLHQQGVNVRYLGTVLSELDRVDEKEKLSHVQRLCISEVIIRSAKHIFRTYLQDVEPAAFSAAVSHFLNCLLTSSSSSSCLPDSCPHELHARRKSRRRRSRGGRLPSLTDSAWTRLTSSELWDRIRVEAREYYHYIVDSGSVDEAIERYGLQRVALLREIAIKTGIQVQLREYVFESRHRPVFGEEDVINMFPVVRHLKPSSTDAKQLIQQAQLAVQRGLLKKGYELISQALTLFSSICGVLHEDVSLCLRLLGRLSYILWDYADAVSHQEKAVIVSERVHGIDHPQTIQDYIYMALYCFAGSRHSTSLQLLYRARYLTLLVCGDDHPQVALLDSMLGLVLHGLMECELSLKFLQNALFLTSKYHGATSLKLAHSHHLVATVYESKGEFRSALQHEKEAYSIYKRQVGETHSDTKESSEYLKSLTQQAVSLQKAINVIYSNTTSACVPPPKFSTPSFLTILQQLNLTCGIVLIPLR